MPTHQKAILEVSYDTNCTQVSRPEWEALMKGARRFSYKKAVALVRKCLPDLYESLALQYRNPWAGDCRRTKTHVILVHSMIEYFLRIEEEV